jgi:SAM-dependent methyltransferase
MGDFDQNAGQRTGREYPRDYHDYVFRDGKLIGDFDNMYRHAKGIPWDQDKHCDRWYAEVGMLMLKDQAPYDTILEIGCGLGFFAAKLKKISRRGTGKVEAFDVSRNAIEKARRLHPGIKFYVDNVSDGSFRPRHQYDLVVVKDVFWYVFEHMQTAIRNIDACVKPKGLLYIGQSFPALESAFIGKEVIGSPEVLKEYFSAYAPLYTAILRNHRLVKDGPVLHFLAVKAR